MLSITQQIGIVIGISSFLLLITGFIVWFVFYYQKKRKEHIQQQERMKTQFHQELLHTQLEIQEQTLKNISQEIHDNIGQTLSLAKLNLNTMPTVRAESLHDKIQDTKVLVSKAIQDLRSLSKTLNTDTILSAGLLNAIKFELDHLTKTGLFVIDLQIEGSPYKLDNKNELILFRIVQEAINNTIKHSNGSEITVKVQFLNSEFRLIMQDNGIGFSETKDAGFESGTGIKNMYNRAQLIGGSINIESNAATGTKIEIRLPVNDFNGIDSIGR